MGTSTQFRDAVLQGSLSCNYPEHEEKKSRRLRSLLRVRHSRPPRAHLERACRIALLESERPLSVEAIYEHIMRRGSLTFLGYKRPFRAITYAMARLVRLGDACLVKTGGERSWCRPMPREESKGNKLLLAAWGWNEVKGSGRTSESLGTLRSYRHVWVASPYVDV